MLRAAIATVVAAVLAACGGSSGGANQPAPTGALETPHPLTVQVTTDTTMAVSGVIGLAGGQVSTTLPNGASMTLNVPRGALLSSHSITLTPIASIAGFPLHGGVLAGAQLGPDGLLLAKAATLTIHLAAAPGGGMKAYGFGYRKAGAELHLMKASGGGTSLSLSIWHFSGAGVGAGTSSDASAQASNPPTAPQDQIEQAQAIGQPAIAMLLGWDALLTTEIGQSPPNLAELDLIYQQTFIFDAMATAAGRPDLAQEIYNKIAAVLQVASALALTNCSTKPDAVEGLRVIRWIEWAQLHLMLLQHLDTAALEAGVVKCLRFKLDFMTHETFTFGPEGIDLTVESKDIAIDAITAVPLTFAPGVGDLKYDSYKWIVPGIQYTMSLSIDRPFTVEDISMNLDLLDAVDPSLVVDGMRVTVDFGDTTETAHVISPVPIPPLPFKSYYANGMQTMHHSSAVGGLLYAIGGWSAGAEPLFATLHETCPCQQIPAAAGVLMQTQDTTWMLRHTPQ